MRTRDYRRNVRKKAINKTKQKILNCAWWSPVQTAASNPGNKLAEALYGNKSGLFSKHDYSAIGGYSAMKTKTKNMRTHPHRHKGGFGPATDYNPHNRKENAKLAQSIADYHSSEQEEIPCIILLMKQKNLAWLS